jgi:hypothetical protein
MISILDARTQVEHLLIKTKNEHLEPAYSDGQYKEFGLLALMEVI